MIFLSIGMALLPQAPAAAAPPPSPIVVALTPHVPAGDERLAWSPKGQRVELAKDGAALAGTFALGPAGSTPVRVRLERTDASGRADVLSVDRDRDGRFGDGERLTTTSKEQRGKWWSSFETVVDVPVAAKVAGAAPKPNPYPLSLWFVEDPREPTAAPVLRWTRRGWHEGEVQLDGRRVFVLAAELEPDGVWTTADAWAIALSRKLLLSSGATAMTEHQWLEERAYRVVQVDPDGLELRIELFDPRTTPAEDQARRDTFKADRESKRAAAPVAFGHDFAAALARAAKERKRVFVDFTTTWCGPCKVMDELVYTADDVVRAAQDVICVQLDGDVERDVAKARGVTAYPTVLLLDADGRELRRAVGYQGVAAIVKFLAK